MYKIFIPVFFLLALSTNAQEIAPRGKFFSDSIKVGMPVDFSLAVSYPKELDVVFPDSSFSFAPFEFEAKRFFPTKTDSVYSYDSAIYTLVSFEVDSVQYLRLPVFLVTPGDSIVFYSQTEAVTLSHVVKEIPDTVSVENMPLKESSEYLPVTFQFNYPYLIIGIIILLILVFLTILIFGKRIRKWWKLRQMTKQYDLFCQQYGTVVERDTEPAIKSADAVATWKRYMEKLTGYPYTKLTTREIYSHSGDERLQNALRNLDKVIYSGQKPTGSQLEAYDELFRYTEDQFNRSVEEVKNG